MKSRFGQIDRQAAVPPLAGLMLAVSAAAGGMYLENEYLTYFGFLGAQAMRAPLSF